MGTDPYPARLDALHEAVRPGGLAAARCGRVLASRRALGPAGPPSLLRLGLACAPAPPPPAATAERFADGLLALQLDVLRRALDGTMARLDGRVSEGQSLLARPQIQADLADAAMTMQEAAVGQAAASWTARQACHLRLADAGRVLLRLLGGHGMLCGPPAADLYLTEVAGNVYLCAGDDDEP